MSVWDARTKESCKCGDNRVCMVWGGDKHTGWECYNCEADRSDYLRSLCRCHPTDVAMGIHWNECQWVSPGFAVGGEA